MIFLGIISVVATILLWDIYKQLRYLNESMFSLIKTMQGKKVFDGNNDF